MGVTLCWPIGRPTPALGSLIDHSNSIVSLNQNLITLFEPSQRRYPSKASSLAPSFSSLLILAPFIFPLHSFQLQLT